MAAGSIVVDLLMRTGSFETDTKRAEKRLEELQKVAVEAGQMIAAGFAVVTTATIALVKTQIDAADEMGKAASKAGVTTESLSALAYAAELSGSSQEDMTQALGKLSRQMSEAAHGGETAKDAFKAIGISITNASGKMKTSDQVFKEIADRFASMPDGIGKTNAAIEIFGRSGANLIPTLNSGSAGLKEMADEAEQLGIIVGGDTATAAAEFNDNLTRLQKTAAGFGLTIANTVLPAMTRLSEETLRLNSGTGLAEIAGKAFNVVLETIAVLAANVAFVLTSIGREIGGIGAQLAAIATLDFKGFSFIGEQMKADAAAAREELDAFERRVLNINKGAGAGRGFVNPEIVKGAGSSFSIIPTGNKKEKDKATNLFVDVPMSTEEKARFEASSKRRQMLDGEKKAIEDYNKVMEEGKRIYEETRTPLEQLNITYGKLDELLQQGIIDWDTYGRAVINAQEQFDKANETTKKTNDLAKELGMTFTSAFEDAIVEGKKLSDVLRGLAQDILRIATRTLVTEPLANALTDGFKKMFGGAYASGGEVLGNRSYLVGENGPEMFTPRTAGTITPNSATSGATIVQNINVTTGVQQTVRAEIISLMPQIAGAAKAAVADAKLRGGSYAAALR